MATAAEKKAAAAETAKAAREARAKLATQTFPMSVIPNPGDVLEGTYLRMSFGPTAFGQQPILIFANEDGEERSLWLLHTAAKSQVAAAKPKPGEGFTFTMLGRRESKATGANYQDCRFVTDSMAAEAASREAGTLDEAALFDSMAAELALPWDEQKAARAK